MTEQSATTKQTVKVDWRAFLSDVKAHIPDSVLATRYGLSPKQVQSAKSKLVEKGLLDSSFIAQVWTCPRCEFKAPQQPSECPRCGLIPGKLSRTPTRSQATQTVEEKADNANTGLSQPQTGYTEGTLAPGERLVCRGKVHMAVFIIPAMVLLVVGIELLLIPETVPSILWQLAGALALFMTASIRFHKTEIAVTNQRVIIKAGLIGYQTIEMNLAKVENIQVQQSVLGRMFDYGHITVVGTGGTRQRIWCIKAPFAFRDAVQAQSYK